MNKYNITRKSFIPKIFISIFVAFFSSISLMTILAPESSGSTDVNDLSPNVQVIVTVVFFSVLLISLVCWWLVIKRHKFYEENQAFIIEKGLFFKNKTTIPFSKINTIALKRSFLDLILKTSKIEIDTGTLAKPISEGKLTLNKGYALELKNYLENKEDNLGSVLPNPKEEVINVKKDQNITYKIGTKRLLAFGLLKPGFLLSLIFSNLFILSFLQIGFLLETETKFTNKEITLNLIITFAIITLVNIVGFIIFNFVDNYNYSLLIKNDKIQYEYGLLSKTSFKVDINKINSLTIKRSILQRLFNLYSLEASIIGIGDLNNNERSKHESKYILPLCNVIELRYILNLLNSEELLDELSEKPKRYKVLKFIMLPLIPITSISSVPLIIFKDYISIYPIIFTLGLAIYVISVLGLILRLKNESYLLSKNFIIKKGSFTTSKLLIKRKNIQSVTLKKGPIDQILNINTVEVSYKKTLGSAKIVGYLKEDYNKIVKEFIS